MDDFVAIDFKTANRALNSACAAGLTVVRAGRITETYSSLIRPPTLDFDQGFISIHGITSDADDKATGSVSKKTNIVVVGDEVLDLYKRSGKTTGTLAKTVELQEAGTPIRIINESEFLEMIE